MPRLRRPLSPVHLLRQILAVGLLACAAVLALRDEPAPTGARLPPTVAVVVAATDLPAGAVLTAADLLLVRLPSAQRPAGAAAEPEQFTGRVLAAPVRRGEALTDVRLVGAGLTALLPEGLVAAPIRLADLAVAALVRSGDRIDVLATVDGGTTAEVVAERALVVASGGPAPSADDAGAGLLLVAVPPDTAARLAAAAATATLTVTLPRP